MANMKISKIFWVGLLISLVTVVFIFGLLYLQDVSFDNSNFSFTVILDNVKGLNEGDNVNMLGKRVGRVTQTRIIGQKIAVELAIDNSFAFRIPIDSKIEVKSEGLFGEKYVSISPGTDLKHFILDGEEVQGTREIDLTEITPGIAPLTQDLAAFARRLRATLGEEEKNSLQETIRNIETLTTELTLLTKDARAVVTEEERAEIRQMIINFRIISDSLKSDLDMEFQKLDNILNSIQEVSDESRTLIESFNHLKDGARKFSESSDSLKTVISRLNQSVARLEGDEGTLPRLLNDDSVYNNLDSLVVELRWIAKDFKENPARYLKAYIKAKKDD